MKQGRFSSHSLSTSKRVWAPKARPAAEETLERECHGDQAGPLCVAFLIHVGIVVRAVMRKGRALDGICRAEMSSLHSYARALLKRLSGRRITNERKCKTWGFILLAGCVAGHGWPGTHYVDLAGLKRLRLHLTLK